MPFENSNKFKQNLPARSFSSAFAVALFAVFAAPNAQAQTLDPLIEGAKLCTRHLQRYERENGIPAHLLSAIASTESGRYHSGLKIKLPWPWTINAEGKGYFFDTKAEAIAAAQKLRMRGVQSMDVGCMQVNLHHHAQAFSSLQQAFEPENNVAYAASFLRELYTEEGSWKQAAADYHSKTPNLGREYVGVVYNSWRNIIDKLRAANISVPASSLAGVNEPLRENKVVASAAPTTATVPKKIVLSENSGSARLADFSGKVVKTNKRKENGLIIVRPEIKVVDSGSRQAIEQNQAPQPLVMASATNAANPFVADAPNVTQQAQPAAAQAQAPQAKIIRLDNKVVSKAPVNSSPSLSAHAPQKSGPNFIFND